ncbi:caspase family protein [Burkholderia ubonensis]|uniref:caspase family protein n=1 Tax=Burkholderia ubonensis TaxID=101571 RepID=UPI0009B37D16|nr:caspase family protein [Burkholderia ubonensis]
MAKALIAIGVGKIDGLFSELRGAASDAREFYEWGQRQGFECHLHTDDQGKVRFADVYATINTVVKKQTYSQIVVYFSGHGVLKAPDCELWLLSDAPENPNEAINVCGSIQLARLAGAEHIVFISDACRSVPQNLATTHLNGTVVFPSMPVRTPLPEIDVFYATIPGDVALEVRADATHPRDRGLLTQHLLCALDGQVPSVIDPHVVAGVPSRVVRSRPLKAWLTSTIPDAAAAIELRLQQIPDIRIESDQLKYLSKLANDVSIMPATQQAEPLAPVESSPASGRPQRMRLVPSRAQSPSRVSAPTMARQPTRVNSSVRSVLDSEVHEFESTNPIAHRSGVIVQGGMVKTGKSPFGPISSMSDATIAWLYFPPEDALTPDASRCITLRFDDDSGIALPIFQGYIATIKLSGRDILSIHYRSARTQPEYGAASSRARDIYGRSARIAVSARLGKLTSDDIERIEERVLREMIAADPTIAIYAAYAHARSGRYSLIEPLMRATGRLTGCMPFDVAMLSGQLSDQPLPKSAPGVPLLTQGWMMMGRFEHQLPPLLQSARNFLQTSMWATYSGPGMEFLESHLFGE